MHRLMFCAMLSVLLLMSSARAQDVLKLSGFEAPNLTPVAESILSQAYGELGIRIQTIITSPRRALLDSASGKTDGELVRIRTIEADHRSLLRVDVPIILARTFAYANKPQLRGKSFKQLRHLRVGHVAGARFAAELARWVCRGMDRRYARTIVRDAPARPDRPCHCRGGHGAAHYPRPETGGCLPVATVFAGGRILSLSA